MGATETYLNQRLYHGGEGVCVCVWGGLRGKTTDTKSVPSGKGRKYFLIRMITRAWVSIQFEDVAVNARIGNSTCNSMVTRIQYTPG